ncbi:MAG TPA: hypothetical protein ENI23_03850 [bacterium]|nr:hypothetical protein [bacterium]
MPLFILSSASSSSSCAPVLFFLTILLLGTLLPLLFIALFAGIKLINVRPKVSTMRTALNYLFLGFFFLFSLSFSCNWFLFNFFLFYFFGFRVFIRINSPTPTPTHFTRIFIIRSFLSPIYGKGLIIGRNEKTLIQDKRRLQYFIGNVIVSVHKLDSNELSALRLTLSCK